MRRIISTLGILIVLCPLTVASCAADEFQDLLSSYHGGDFQTAAGNLEEYVKQHPKHAESRFFLAKSYMGLKQGSLAEDQLRACMELAPPGSELQANCIVALKEISQSRSLGKSSTPGKQRNNASTQGPVVTSSQSGHTAAGSVQQLGTLRRVPNPVQPLPKGAQAKGSGGAGGSGTSGKPAPAH